MNTIITESKELGIRGEKLATRFLKKHHYKILANNFTIQGGEIDIICFDKKNKEYVFVEVKTRSNCKYFLPRQAVNFKKKNNIRRIALTFMRWNKIVDQPYRFDIIEVVDDYPYHIKNAF